MGIAAAVAGAWLLAVSPDTSSHHRAWKPGPVVAITEDTTDNESWAWSFNLPNNGEAPVKVHVEFRFNLSQVKRDTTGHYWVESSLLVDGTDADGLVEGSPLLGPGNYDRHDLEATWSLRPGEEARVEARATNLHNPYGIDPSPDASRGRDWQLDYDPVHFRVTTTTRELDWAWAGPGAGILLAGFAAMAVATVPPRLRVQTDK